MVLRTTMRDNVWMPDGDEGAAELRRRQLRDFMKSRGLKARPWAKAAGLKSDGTIRNFLSGISKTMNHSTVESLAVAASATIADIFPDGGAPTVEGGTPRNPKRSLPKTTESGVTLIDARLPTLVRDLPIRGHTRAGQQGYFIDQGETWGYAMRPESLRGVTEAYAVRVHDDCMDPRYEPGTVLQVDPFRDPKPGDNVIIQLADGQAFVKILVRRAAGIVSCRQLNPKKTVTFKKDQVRAVHLVVGVDYLER